MSRFLLLLESGPCMGAYETARAPLALRAVRARGGKLDVLDLVEDTPEPGEELFLYQHIDGRTGHMCGRGGCSVTVSYRYVGPLDGETGEISDVAPEDREWWERQRHEAMLAWAAGERHQVTDPPRQGTLL